MYRALIRSGCGGKKRKKNRFSQQSYTYHARYLQGSCLFRLREKKKKKKSVFKAKLYTSRAMSTGLLSVPAAGGKKGEKFISHSKVIRITRDIHWALVCSCCGHKNTPKNVVFKKYWQIDWEASREKWTVYTTVMCIYHYGVAKISRLLQIKGLFCRITSVL